MAVKKKKATKRKRKQKMVPVNGVVYITAGFNNTLITITDVSGNTLFSGSGGSVGFKGSRKSTPYAATKTAEDVAQRAVNAGMTEVSVKVKGPGMGRISAIKALRAAGLKVTAIADITKLPHNGCRPKKPRRI
jgi:small subunit ribosomal protein S11